MGLSQSAPLRRHRPVAPCCSALVAAWSSRNAALQGLQSNAVRDVEDIVSGARNGSAVLCK